MGAKNIRRGRQVVSWTCRRERQWFIKFTKWYTIYGSLKQEKEGSEICQSMVRNWPLKLFGSGREIQGYTLNYQEYRQVYGKSHWSQINQDREDQIHEAAEGRKRKKQKTIQ
jgi:hypothetical protein